MISTLTINPSETEKQIVSFIKNTVDQAGFFRVVVGLSGGIDSAVSCALAVEALGAENVFPVMLPYGKLNDEATKDARSVIKSLQIPHTNITVIDIQKIVEQFVSLNFGMDKLRKGNIIARVRMTCLFDLSKKYQALVLGTENKTEHLLGYYTRFGDAASDIEPLIHLYKTQVRQLAVHLNIPWKIIDKVPSAGLWEEQTDEGEFGFTYEDADKVLSLYVDGNKNEEEVVQLGVKEETFNKIVKRLKINSFKCKLPYTL